MADVLELLIAERDRLDQAIAVLQGPRRRGSAAGLTEEGCDEESAARGLGCRLRRGNAGARG